MFSKIVKNIARIVVATGIVAGVFVGASLAPEPVNAQSSGWVMINGVLQFAGNVTVTGNFTVTGTCTGCGTPITASNTQVVFKNGSGDFVGDADMTFTGGDTLNATKAVIPTLYGSAADNGDIAIEGTSSATKTTSDVLIQPTAGHVYIGPYETPLDTGAGLGIFHAVTASWFVRDTTNNVEFGGYTSGGASGFGTASNHSWSLFTNNANKWTLQAAGHLVAAADNTYDIGASGATRPRTGYFGTSVVAPLIHATGTVVFDGTTTSSGPGAVAVTGAIHEITTTGTGDALTLADGTEGQRLTIVYVAEGAGTDTAVVTPTNFGSGTTITFSTVGQSIRLIFTNGKWYAESAPFGAVIA